MEFEQSEIRQHPNIECNCTLDEFIILMLAKARWWNGSPSAILSAPIDWVMRAYNYENFINKYQNAEMEINRKS